MRRADRLFQIIQTLRSRRVTTAQRLAEELEVSERTIYRDVQDLMMSGVPIEGEAGVGYALRRGFDLPPLMFSEDEIAAVTLGIRLVKSWADPLLAKAADQALSKVELVLPDKLRTRLTESKLFSPMVRIPPEVATVMAALRPAIDTQRKVRFYYTREDGVASERTVWPLGLFFWGPVWTLGAWCELRSALRNFRLDRVQGLTLLAENYPALPGRTLDDLFREACTPSVPEDLGNTAATKN